MKTIMTLLASFSFSKAAAVFQGWFSSSLPWHTDAFCSHRHLEKLVIVKPSPHVTQFPLYSHRQVSEIAQWRPPLVASRPSSESPKLQTIPDTDQMLSFISSFKTTKTTFSLWWSVWQNKTPSSNYQGQQEKWLNMDKNETMVWMLLKSMLKALSS